MKGYSNCVVIGIVNDVRTRKVGDKFVASFSIINEHSGQKIVSSAWSDSVLNIRDITDGAYATARGYFKPVRFERKDGSVYQGREFVLRRGTFLQDYKLNI